MLKGKRQKGIDSDFLKGKIPERQKFRTPQNPKKAEIQNPSKENAQKAEIQHSAKENTQKAGIQNFLKEHARKGRNSEFL